MLTCIQMHISRNCGWNILEKKIFWRLSHQSVKRDEMMMPLNFWNFSMRIKVFFSSSNGSFSFSQWKKNISFFSGLKIKKKIILFGKEEGDIHNIYGGVLTFFFAAEFYKERHFTNWDCRQKTCCSQGSFFQVTLCTF